MQVEDNFNKMMADRQRAKNDMTPGQASYSTANLEQFSLTPFKNDDNIDTFLDVIETNKNFAASQLTYEQLLREREKASQRQYFEQAKATDNKDIDFAKGQIQMQAKKIV